MKTVSGDMQTTESVRIAAAVVDVAVPARSGRVAGVSMAGFRGRAEGSFDLRMVPYPALTVFIDFGDALFVDDTSGARKQGSFVVGLAPGSIRGVRARRGANAGAAARSTDPEAPGRG